MAEHIDMLIDGSGIRLTESHESFGGCLCEPASQPVKTDNDLCFGRSTTLRIYSRCVSQRRSQNPADAVEAQGRRNVCVELRVRARTPTYRGMVRGNINRPVRAIFVCVYARAPERVGMDPGATIERHRHQSCVVFGVPERRFARGDLAPGAWRKYHSNRLYGSFAFYIELWAHRTARLDASTSTMKKLFPLQIQAELWHPRGRSSFTTDQDASSSHLCRMSAPSESHRNVQTGTHERLIVLLVTLPNQKRH